MNILISGDCGFVGQHLVSKLTDLKYNLRGMDIRHSELEDVRSYADCLVNTQGIDCVVHLAAFTDVQGSIKDKMTYCENNIQGTVNLLEASRANGVKRFIFASSAASENPQSPYGVTKLCGEAWCDVFQKCYGLSTVSLRFFNVFGNGAVNGVIPKWMDMIKRGESPVINGDGEQTRDFVYVEDVVDAIIKAMNSDVNGVYEVGSGMETSILQLCDILLTEMKSNLKIKFREGLTGEVRESVSDKKRWLPKWKPQYILLEKGVREMLR